MQPGASIIKRIGRYWLWLDAANLTLRFLALASLLWGCLLLTARLVGMVNSRQLIGSIVALSAIAVVVAVNKAWRRRPGADKLRAWLDEHHRQGGLLLLAGEQELGAWSDHLAPSMDSQVRWRPGKPLASLIGSLAFCGLCGWIPIRTEGPTSNQALAIHRQLDTAEARLDDLERLSLLDEVTLDTFRTDLANLEKEAEDGALRADHIWRTLDEWERNLDTRVAAERALLGETMKANKALGDLADRVAQQIQFLDESQQQQALAGLRNLLRDIEPETLTEWSELSNQMPMSLSPKAAKNLSRLLKMSRETLQRTMESSASNQPTSEMQHKQLLDFLERDLNDQQLKDFLDQNNLEFGDKNALLHCLGGGTGVADDGNAPLTWKDEDILEEGPFKPQALPIGKGRLEDTVLLGERRGAPGNEEPGQASYGGLTNSEAGSGTARIQPILPKHHGAIRRYFNGEKKDR